ncbi:MAG: ribonuclease HI family protein [Fimbriimonadia bacterium]|nr:ribonuclease HI family protein [Fimbriimonadia bacterium]
MKAFLYTDGASRGNPGDAGIGAVLMDENGTVLDQISEYIGKTTNNVAEYTALIRGLELANQHGVSELVWCSDSELIVRQWTGIYRVKDLTLQELFEKAKALSTPFLTMEARHILREYNRIADSLATKGAKQKPSLR